VLVVVADATEADRLVRGLSDDGHLARAVADGAAAVDALVRERFDALLIDVELPEMPGREVVAVVRAYDVEVPIVVMTNDVSPWIGAGVAVIARSAPIADLVRAVGRAKHSRRDTVRLRRELTSEPPVTAPEDLNTLFDRALGQMYVAFQPILLEERDSVFGYEALMRSREPNMSTPPALLAAAERLGRLSDLGGRVRTLAATAFTGAPDDALLFVNLHSSDLVDAALYDSGASLSAIAPRVVLEITERATIEDVTDVSARLSVLRFQGFRIAVDDLGAGYAGLTSFATVEPEFVKLDMSLVRRLHTSHFRRRLVSSVIDACRDLGTSVVAEGIESEEELRALRAVGCELFQGYLFARPSDSFAQPSLRAR
jgi:EAL domain-containing protein (putative c-di-GMP-specific phosphodiesterase class I)/CheY-like chemotaxis protein